MRRTACTNRLEQKLVVAYEKIPKNAQMTELMVTQKIDQIVQTIDQYQQEIEHLWEKLTPTTPPEVKEKRKQEETMQIKEIERQVHAATDLFEKATQLWTKLEEDQQVQQWDQEGERISATIQDLKQRQKTMPIMEHVKGAQGYEETAGRTHSCADTEKGVPGSNGTAPGASNRGHCTGGGSQNEYGTNPGRVCKDGQR
jgi:catalase